jgi:hypothetical protein
MSILLLKEYFDTSYIDQMFCVKVLCIVGASWLPLHILYLLLNWCDPSESSKMEQVDN